MEDIIASGLGELRKNAFGEDIDDAKSLPWSREQAWIVLKQLARKPEVLNFIVLVNNQLTFLVSCHITTCYSMRLSRETSYRFVLWNTLRLYPSAHSTVLSRHFHWRGCLISFFFFLGRPSTIRPGKPVFKYVFERLVNGNGHRVHYLTAPLLKIP